MIKKWIKRGLLIFLAVLLFTVAIVPLFLPSPKGKYTEEQLADADSRFVTIDNVKVHYKTYGKGEPYYILLHGTLMTTYTWHKIVEPLSKKGTVIAYDRPSFGLTSRPKHGDWKNASPYSYESQVELLRQLMDSFGIKKAILVGNSMGGAIAAMTAQKYPERVQALVLDDAVQSRHGVNAFLRVLASPPQMRKIGSLFLQHETLSFGRYLYKLSYHDPSKIQQTDFDEMTKVLDIKGFDQGLWELISVAKPFEQLVHPEKINVPTLVIAGDDDRIAGVKSLKNGTLDIINMAGEIKNSRMVVIPQCGHLPHEECPEEFMKAVTEFVSELPAA